MAAYELTKAGATRRPPRGRRNVGQHQGLDDARCRRGRRRAAAAPHAERPFGEYDACIGGWNVPGEPFTTAPGTKFDWWRARMLGGRTNHWGRISLRFGPDDFQRKSIDGLGDDWPITYDDMKPVVRRSGRADRHLRQRRGAAQPPRRHLPAGAQARAAGSCWSSRPPTSTASPASRRDSRSSPAAQRPRRLPLLRPVQSRLQDQLELLLDQRPDCPRPATGKLTIVTNAMVREVTHRQDGLADGVVYIDKATRRGAAGERARSWCSPPAPARPRASCSTPSRRGFRTGSATRAAWSASTSPIPPAPMSSGFIPTLVRPAAPQLRRRRRGAPLHAVVARQQEARLPARLPHRDLGRAGHAGLRLHGRDPELSAGAAATARRSSSEYRRYWGRRSASPAAAR